jgi:hypothetical protein
MGRSGLGKTLKKQGLNRKQRKHARHKSKLSIRQQRKKDERIKRGFGKKK